MPHICSMRCKDYYQLDMFDAELNAHNAELASADLKARRDRMSLSAEHLVSVQPMTAPP